MKPLIAFLCLIATNTQAQSYFKFSAGRDIVSLSLQTGAEGVKNLTYGFGIGVFTNEGKRGMDYTNFYSAESPEVYEVVRSQNASIFFMLGKTYKNNVSILSKIGFGANKWYYNGKTGGQLWYVTKDGGTYLLYGGEVSKSINKILLGIGYDNFNGALITIGVKINEK